MGETAGVTQDVGSDPTVGLPFCLLCGSAVVCEGRLERRPAEDELHEGLRKSSAVMQKL